MAFERIVISCMDRRLSEHIEKTYNDGKTLFFRNAGANIGTLSNSIKQAVANNPINIIEVLPHSDCGAMKVTLKALNGEMQVSAEIDSGLVNQFKGTKFTELGQLEASNVKVQDASITKLVKFGTKTHTELCDIAKIKDTGKDSEHILVIMAPSAAKYSEVFSRIKMENADPLGMYSAYVIQANNLVDIMPDIEIAITALHIKKVFFVSQSASENKQLLADVRVLKSMPFILDSVAVSLVMAR